MKKVTVAKILKWKSLKELSASLFTEDLLL